MNYFLLFAEPPCPDPLSGGDLVDEVLVSSALGSLHICVPPAWAFLFSRCRKVATALRLPNLLSLRKAIGALCQGESAAFTVLLLLMWGFMVHHLRVLPAQLFMTLCSSADYLVFDLMQISSLEVGSLFLIIINL